MELKLRLILLAIGLVIIGLIYAWGMRSRIKANIAARRRRHQQQRELLREPTLGVAQSDPVTAPAAAGGAAAPSPQAAGPLGAATGGAGDSVAAAKPVTAPADVGPAAEPAPRSEPAAETSRAHEAQAEAAVATAAAASAADGKAADKPPLWTPPPVKPKAPPNGGRRRAAKVAESDGPPGADVLLMVIAPPDKPYSGKNILRVMRELSMPLSKTGVWECTTEVDRESKLVFGVGHLREPGTFDMDTIDNLQTTGLLLFMQLPGPLEAKAAVDLMMATARQLAQELGGTVCDPKRNKLTPQYMIHLRDEAADFDRRWQAYQSSVHA